MKPFTRTARRTITSLLAVLVITTILASSPIRGQSIQPSTQTTKDCEPVGDRICKLAVQITTRKERGAGTDNAVYFDIGPLSWRLNNPRHNDFESGNTDEFDLTIPRDPAITTDDILWLRLQKKGLFGYNGTRDGLAGAWHPERLVLIVNGVARPAVHITEPLNSRCWFWRSSVAMNPPNPYSSAANFARTLRLQRNDELNRFAKIIAFAATVPKKWGISGWLSLTERKECLNGKPLGTPITVPWSVCATGRVIASAKSTDGLATIDLETSKVEFCGKDGKCDDRAILKDLDPANRPRYLRIEYKHRGQSIPKVGEPVRLCGKLLWDTDREGWWEIHPRNCQDVTFLSPNPQKCTRPG